MFNYPSGENSYYVAASIEQSCIDCGKWYTVAEKDVKRLNADVKKSHEDHVSGKNRYGGVPIRMISCPHCKEKQILCLVGKYDRPNAKTRKSCSCQFVKLATPKKVGK